MEEETIGMVAWNRFAKLLQGPGRHWMCGDVARCAVFQPPSRGTHREFGTGRSLRPGNRRRRWTGRDCEQTPSSSAKKSSGGLVAPVREANSRYEPHESRVASMCQFQAINQNSASPPVYLVEFDGSCSFVSSTNAAFE